MHSSADSQPTAVSSDLARALATAGLSLDGEVQPLGQHADRPVLLWPTAGGDVVVKIHPDAAAARAAHAVARSLWRSPFGARRSPPGLAEPLLLVARCGAVVSRRLDGATLRAADEVTLRPRLPEVARLLADLHDSGCALTRQRDARGVVRSMRRKAADLASTPLAGGAATVSELIAERLPGLPGPPGGLVSTHGDAAPHNVLGGALGLRLVDWDRAVLADPARDLAQFGASVWANAVIDGRAPDWTMFDDLVAAYSRGRPGLDGARLAVYRACALVRSAHGKTAFRRDPARAAPLLTEAERLLRRPW